ncbi:hypothetical protein M9434_003114 [Picochlorum sp. BPE23]|nr:hypothetical protein M9434_003114 [Picochlorum sp. BPE23]
MEKEIEQIVARALSRERRLWFSIMASVLILQLFAMNPAARVSQSVSGASSSLSVEQVHPTTRGLRRSLMSLQGAPSSEMAPAPAPDRAPAPAPESEESENVDQSEEEEPSQCSCPRGPAGPPGPQGEPAPEFLSNIFEWDEDKGALTINAGSVNLAGHLIVNGFTGIRESLFIGGDPNSGESATEISGGSILLYKQGQDPTIAGFRTDPDKGYEPANVEFMGGITVVDPNTAETKTIA